jgi:hypothetical protein
MKRGLFMSYMDTHAAFAPAGGIQELSWAPPKTSGI